MLRLSRCVYCNKVLKNNDPKLPYNCGLTCDIAHAVLYQKTDKISKKLNIADITQFFFDERSVERHISSFHVSTLDKNFLKIFKSVAAITVFNHWPAGYPYADATHVLKATFPTEEEVVNWRRVKRYDDYKEPAPKKPDLNYPVSLFKDPNITPEEEAIRKNKRLYQIDVQAFIKERKRLFDLFKKKPSSINDFDKELREQLKKYGYKDIEFSPEDIYFT